MNKKIWGISPVRATLTVALCWMMVSCPVSNPKVEDPQIMPDPPGPVPGTFAVALATRATKAGAAAKFVADGANGSQVNGLGVGLTAVQAAPAPDPAVWGSSALELWLNHDSYFNSDGSAKPHSSGGSDFYAVWWDAYDPAVSPPASLVAAAPATDKVALDDSFAGADKVARQKLQVGNTLLSKATGVVVVLRVYAPGIPPADMSLAKDSGMLGEFKLTITQAASIDLTGATVSAKGTASASAATQSELSALTALAPAPFTLNAGSTSAATATLLLQPAATVGQKVSFSNFVIAAAKSLEGPSWSIKGYTSSTAGVLATAVALDGDAAATGSTELFFPADATAAAQVRADFTATKGASGQVTLLAIDKYGQQASVVVTLSTTPPPAVAFSVALAPRVSATTSAIVATGETSTNVLGMGVKVDALEIITGVQLEVWLVNDTYVNADGSPKDQAPGQPYAIKWDAYAPSAATTSLSGAAATGSVEFLAAASGKASHTKVRVGDTLLANSAGVVVVALVYAHGTTDMGLGKSAGKVAEYPLALTKLAAPSFSFAGASVSAKAVAAMSTLGFSVLKTFRADQAAVTADPSNSAGTALLKLHDAATVDNNIASFLFMPLIGVAADMGIKLVNIAGSASSAADKVSETFVGVDPANNSTSSQAVDVGYTDSGFVNFTATPTNKGKVTLTYEDKKGVRGRVVVTLDPKY